MPKTKGFGKNPTLKFGSRFWGDLLYSTGTKISQPGECGLIVVRRRANLGKKQKIHVFPGIVPATCCMVSCTFIRVLRSAWYTAVCHQQVLIDDTTRVYRVH